MTNCEKCKKEVPLVVETYSKNNFRNHVFCRDCQSVVKKEIEAAKPAGSKPTNSKPVTTSNKQITMDGLPKDMPPEYVMDIKGKRFIKAGGLLWAAHDMGLKSIRTEMISDNNSQGLKEPIHIFKATVIMSGEKGTDYDQVFTGYGDASIGSVTGMIAPHIIRMAETRAINRALRLATNIGLCSLEELGEMKD